MDTTSFPMKMDSISFLYVHVSSIVKDSNSDNTGMNVLSASYDLMKCDIADWRSPVSLHINPRQYSHWDMLFLTDIPSITDAAISNSDNSIKKETAFIFGILSDALHLLTTFCISLDLLSIGNLIMRSKTFDAIHGFISFESPNSLSMRSNLSLLRNVFFLRGPFSIIESSLHDFMSALSENTGTPMTLLYPSMI